ncbi:ATP-binding protein [Ornithobacterium rhinotracheale]|uniref:ATP-binding protein n=1 Tax=Ornithobacterium rhinotracheale TaxID=28251 RepID=UPI001FF6A5A8|nr:ATP-binding protein [Ornithobacterium rhinotracheale]MCK0205968.1 ATP-binding protein [Ornithobacterium rhinotracheale]
MRTNAYFKVDPKLAELLGETYKSTEDAIKELIDNAYDADADTVKITLPQILEPNPTIIIEDDGTGMKERELRTEYLKIANSRYSRNGARSLIKKRKIKGRKGIGKFSGLMVAEIMEVITQAYGVQTKLTIIKSELAKQKYELDKVELPIEISDCPKNLHGTKVILKGINQSFVYPNPEKLKKILIWDYGRENDFEIFVNNEKIGVQDFSGQTYKKTINLGGGKSAHLIYTITDKPVKHPGLIYRVNGKIVGRPINLLKDNEIIPDKLKKRVVGEIICDDLEEFVTADWSTIVEGCIINENITKEVKSELENSLNDVYKTDMHLARIRYKQKIDRELQKLPEYKRSFAEKYLHRILEKFYDDKEEKVNIIISVMIDALEKDYYWNVINDIDSCHDGDIEKLANALNEFGLLEMSIVTNQAIRRLKFLDEMDALTKNPNTLEETIHKALEKNLWILGNEYSLIFSNKTLSKAIKDYLDKEFKGNRANKRPDLFLGNNILREHLLIEFKRPSFTIGRDAESQALKYRDDLNTMIHNKSIKIMIIGGKVNPNISSHNERDDVKLLTYTDIISNSRVQLEWLIKELKD